MPNNNSLHFGLQFIKNAQYIVLENDLRLPTTESMAAPERHADKGNLQTGANEWNEGDNRRGKPEKK